MEVEALGTSGGVSEGYFNSGSIRNFGINLRKKYGLNQGVRGAGLAL
jgi:hypothetical protein